MFLSDLSNSRQQAKWPDNDFDSVVPNPGATVLVVRGKDQFSDEY